jgi:hypothetical protein
MMNWYLEISCHHEYIYCSEIREAFLFCRILLPPFPPLHIHRGTNNCMVQVCISLRGIFSYCSFHRVSLYGASVPSIRGTRSVRRTRTTRTPAHVLAVIIPIQVDRWRFHLVSSLSCFARVRH